VVVRVDDQLFSHTLFPFKKLRVSNPENLVKIFSACCYGRIIYVLCVKIICGQRGVEGEIEREADMSHLSS